MAISHPGGARAKQLQLKGTANRYWMFLEEENLAGSITGPGLCLRVQMSSIPTTFIFSYERPIYLWATLDSLYRATRSDMHFVLVDSGSSDPLVERVIEGFVRRDMLDEVIRVDRDDTSWFVPFFDRRFGTLGDVFFSVESDVVIREEPTCWAGRMLGVTTARPRLAMLGSRIDNSDFIDAAALEARLGRTLSPEERKQIKLASSEREMPEMGPDEVQLPFNPPGRLLALRTEPIAAHVTRWEQSTDHAMNHILRRAGWETGIYGGVIHRHLSLCNIFDYPAYSMAERDMYMKGAAAAAEPAATEAAQAAAEPAPRGR